ncbi:hypothetical protein MMC30_009440 [Trapelia coarctata]|nr:hypothetical protein [Trapelia coarctata]
MPSGSTITLINHVSSAVEHTVFGVTPGYGGKYNSKSDDKLYLVNFDVVGAEYFNISGGVDIDTIKASECAMWMCIQAYNVSTHTNNQLQTLVQNFSYIEPSKQRPPSTGPGMFTFNHTFPPLPAEMHATPGTDFNVSLAGLTQYVWTLETMFNGTGNLVDPMGEPSSDSVEAVWKHSANLDPWIKQVALSMTNALRNSSTGQSDDVIYAGTGYQLGVSVRWPWIALPAAMVAASLVFLAIVMVQTLKSPVEAWKGSPLAFLFFDVEQEIKRNVMGHTDRFEGIENSVSDARVMLKGKPGGIWTFKAA